MTDLKEQKVELEIQINNAADRRLSRIGIDDERLKKNRGSSLSSASSNPGVVFFDDKVLLTPAQVLHNQATLLVDSWTMLRLMERVSFAIIADIDTSSYDLPQIGQRVPTKSRINGILGAWQDEKITPNYHSEIIHLFVYNSYLDSVGMYFDNDSLICIGDGAGRLSSLLFAPHAAENIQFQLSIDLWGEIDRQLKVFLKYGRDNKRITKGTNLGVEHALLNLDEKGMRPTSILDRNASTYVVEQLWENYRAKKGTWLQLAGWSTEAGKLDCDKRKGSANITAISTVLNSFKNLIAETGIHIDDLPEVIDYGFRYFYQNCPTAVDDAENNRGRTFHFHSVLACKLIILMTILFWEEADSIAHFDYLVRKALTIHYDWEKKEYINTKAKTMTPNRFFTTSKFFCTGQFNSGFATSSELLKKIEKSCNKALSEK
jgi:hypothetical protein